MITTAVVAHVKREAMAKQLAVDVEADVFMDDGTLGCEQNHRRAWEHLAHAKTEFALVLEDDAIPVPDFTHQAIQALAVAPSDVVSLYLGTGRPIWFELAGRGSAQRLQPLIRDAVNQAHTEQACFITAPKLFHGVAVAIRTPLIGSMLTHTRVSPKPIDFAIGDWCVTEGHTVAYTVPSLCNHDDGPTVIRTHPDGEPRMAPRTAHMFGGRITWTSKAVELS